MTTKHYRSTSNKIMASPPSPYLIVIWTAASHGPVFTTQRVPLSLFFQAPRSESKLWIKFLCCCLATDRQRPHSAYLPASIWLQPRARLLLNMHTATWDTSNLRCFHLSNLICLQQKPHRHTIKKKNLCLLVVAHVEHGKTINRNSGI